MDRTYAFVDESGNPDLDTSKEGSSGFFIVCSIIVAENNLEAAYAQAEALRKRHFQTGEIKSSKLRPKDSDRRARILNELAELPFKLFFTVVDKSRIHKDGGLRFKTSFIKYVNGLLYERLFSTYRDLQMVVDEHGGQEFQQSLRGYVVDRFVDDLFGDKDAFKTVSSKDNVLVQVADFFAGSVAQIYEDKASDEAVIAYKKVLRCLTIGMVEWPPKFQSFLPPPTDESGYADYEIHQEAIRQAERFSESVGQHPDESQHLQLSILRFLRFQSEFVTTDYVLTTEIIAHLKERGFGQFNSQKIRSSGVAKLRDAGVIISSAAKGYKIPQTRADINDFLQRASGIIVPLLERVKKARETYRLSSRGEYDIVKAAGLKELDKLIASLEGLADR